MIFYRTAANPFELASSAEVISIGDCIESDNGSVIERGVLLGSNLINKISVGTLDPTHFNFPILNWSLNQSQAFDRGDNYPVEHRPVRLNPTDTPAFKGLSYLAQSYLHVYYKELKNNGTAFGDDNIFNIGNNQSTVPDNNGETVIVGQKRVALPYIFDGDLY